MFQSTSYLSTLDILSIPLLWFLSHHLSGSAINLPLMLFCAGIVSILPIFSSGCRMLLCMGCRGGIEASFCPCISPSNRFGYYGSLCCPWSLIPFSVGSFARPILSSPSIHKSLTFCTGFLCCVFGIDIASMCLESSCSPLSHLTSNPNRSSHSFLPTQTASWDYGSGCDGSSFITPNSYRTHLLLQTRPSYPLLDLPSYRHFGSVYEVISCRLFANFFPSCSSL